MHELVGHRTEQKILDDVETATADDDVGSAQLRRQLKNLLGRVPHRHMQMPGQAISIEQGACSGGGETPYLQGDWRDEGIAFQSVSEIPPAQTQDTVTSLQPEMADDASLADPMAGADPAALAVAFDAPGYVGIADTLQDWV